MNPVLYSSQNYYRYRDHISMFAEKLGCLFVLKLLAANRNKYKLGVYPIS